MSAMRPAHFEHQRIFQFPGVVDYQQHLTRSDSALQLQGQRRVVALVRQFMRSDAKQDAPATQDTGYVGPGSQSCPQDAIVKVRSHLFVVRQGNGKRGFAYTWQTMQRG